MEYRVDNSNGINCVDTTTISSNRWNYHEESPTCYDSGRSWEECGCGEVRNETEISALGHNWVSHVESGSCMDDYKSWDECTNCGEKDNEIFIPSTGHIYDDDSDDYCNICSYNRNFE